MDNLPTAVRSKKEELAVYQNRFSAVLKDTERGKIFAAQVLLTLESLPEIAAVMNRDKNEARSFMNQLIPICTAGLSPLPQQKHIAILKFNNKINIIIGYQGYCKVARDNGITITAQTVFEKDKFELNLGENTVSHVAEALKPRGNAVGYYATAVEIKNGAKLGCVFKTVAQIQEFKQKYIKTNAGPWATAFDEMAKKTLVRNLVKYLGIDFMRPEIVNEYNELEKAQDPVIDADEHTYDNVPQEEFTPQQPEPQTTAEQDDAFGDM